MLTYKTLQVNKNLKKPEVPLLNDKLSLKLYLSHHSNRSLVRMLNYFVGLINNFKDIRPSQDRMAREVDVSLSQLHRRIKQAEDIGLINITHRYSENRITLSNPLGQMTNSYKLHPLFYDMDFRNYLKDLIPCFVYLPLSVLLITSTIAKECRLENKKISSGSKHAVREKILESVNSKRANTVCAREEFALKQKQLSINIEDDIRKRLVSNDSTLLYDNSLFTQSVRNAGRELGMSCAGMCSITSFNDVVINIALKRIKSYTVRINNPYGLFVSLCNQASQEMRMPVKHQRAYALAQALTIRLGSVASVLEGANQPREAKTLQREDAKISYHRPYQSTAPSKVSHDAVVKKNPDMTIVGIELLSPGVYRVQHTHDIAWRETTQKERDLWLQNMINKRPQNQFTRFLPIEPPTMFQGDPNSISFKIYHADDDGKLHDPDKKVIGCTKCNSKKTC